jgi:CobQ-like glutamine amidotransferase family enzyme
MEVDEVEIREDALQAMGKKVYLHSNKCQRQSNGCLLKQVYYYYIHPPKRTKK